VRIAPQKDFDTLALAAAKVIQRCPDTRFLVVGDHSSDLSLRTHLGKVMRRLHELGITDKFIFTGYRTDVPRLIGAMDICVLCTHREGFPLSILEFMAMRKPVVATAVGGIPEIVKHGETGYLHQHLDSDGLADAIISLIEDPASVERLASTGRETVRRDYSPQKYAETMSAMYFDTLGSKPDANSATRAAPIAKSGDQS
jgi:glycosyltransferase involved in cell wall biosynthesis